MRRLLLTLTILAGLTLGCGETVTEEPPSSTAPSLIPAAKSEVTVDTVAPSPSGTIKARQPRHLRLWDFEAPVVALLLAGDTLEPPADPKVLGWWGRPAGAKHGVTLLTGHTVSTGGGTLDDLEHVPTGTTGSLSGVEYTVKRVEVISKETLAKRAPTLFSQTGKHRLVIVTCEDYDVATGEYDSNVVVTMTRSGA